MDLWKHAHRKSEHSLQAKSVDCKYQNPSCGKKGKPRETPCVIQAQPADLRKWQELENHQKSRTLAALPLGITFSLLFCNLLSYFSQNPLFHPSGTQEKHKQATAPGNSPAGFHPLLLKPVPNQPHLSLRKSDWTGSVRWLVWSNQTQPGSLP